MSLPHSPSAYFIEDDLSQSAIALKILQKDQVANDHSSYFKAGSQSFQKKVPKQREKIQIYQLMQPGQNQKNARTTLTEERKRHIIERLNIQKQSNIKLKQRTSLNLYYLNYQHNPFSLSDKDKIQIQLQQKQKKQNIGTKKTKKDQKAIKLTDSQIKQNQCKRYYDIIGSLDSLKEIEPMDEFEGLIVELKNKNKKIVDFPQNIFSKLQLKNDFFKQKQREELEDNKNLRYNILAKLFTKIQREEEKKKLEAKIQILTKDDKNSNNTKGQIQNQKALQALKNLYRNHNITFEQIIQIKQDNYFYSDKYSKKVKNISKLISNIEEDKILTKDILKKEYFCMKSLYEKIGSFKLPVYRQMSDIARKVIVGVKLYKESLIEYVVGDQLNFKLNNIVYQDLMSIATSRFSPDFILEVMNGTIKEKSSSELNQENSQVSQQTNIINFGYSPKNTQQYLSKFCAQNQQQKQIEAFLNFQKPSQSLQHQKIYESFKQQIIKRIYLQQSWISSSIYDKYNHQLLQKKIKSLLKEFISKNQQGREDIDREMIKNKIKKIDEVGIKIQKFLQALILNNQHMKLVNRFNKIKLNESDLNEQQNSWKNFNDNDEKVSINSLILSRLNVKKKSISPIKTQNSTQLKEPARPCCQQVIKLKDKSNIQISNKDKISTKQSLKSYDTSLKSDLKRTKISQQSNSQTEKMKRSTSISSSYIKENKSLLYIKNNSIIHSNENQMLKSINIKKVNFKHNNSIGTEYSHYQNESNVENMAHHYEIKEIHKQSMHSNECAVADSFNTVNKFSKSPGINKKSVSTAFLSNKTPSRLNNNSNNCSYNVSNKCKNSINICPVYDNNMKTRSPIVNSKIKLKSKISLKKGIFSYHNQSVDMQQSNNKNTKNRYCLSEWRE